MGNIQRTAWPALVVLLSMLFISVLSVPVNAQETELSQAIRASLLSDPRSQNLSEDEFDSMVQALTAAATEEGMTARDIMWRPEEPEPEVTQDVMLDTCGNLPAFLCVLNESLGFSSGNLMIPLLLFMGSFALLFVLGLMVKMHHRIPTPPAIQKPTSNPSSGGLYT